MARWITTDWAGKGEEAGGSRSGFGSCRPRGCETLEEMGAIPDRDRPRKGDVGAVAGLFCSLARERERERERENNGVQPIATRRRSSSSDSGTSAAARCLQQRMQQCLLWLHQFHLVLRPVLLVESPRSHVGFKHSERTGRTRCVFAPRHVYLRSTMGHTLQPSHLPLKWNGFSLASVSQGGLGEPG